jgi:hypothetical protein
MRHALTSLVLASALALGACRAMPVPVVGGGKVPPGFDAGGMTAVDVAACDAEAPLRDGAIEVGSALPWCGGTIALSGVTPFGPFAPNAVAVTIEISPPLMRVTLAQDPPSGQQLTFDVPGDAKTGSFVGVRDLTAFLAHGAEVMPLFLSVAVTSATPALSPDGGHPDAGEATISLTITTPCDSFSGTLSGTVVALYCDWQVPI